MAAEETNVEHVAPFFYNIFVVRHGERIDYVDKKWLKKVNHNRYRDPHLDPNKGLKQCKEAGARLLQILKNNYKQQKQIQFSEENLVIISSPYIRCCETAAEIARQLQYKSSIKIEPGICEVLKEYPPHFQDNAQINQHPSCKDMFDVNGNTYTPIKRKQDYKGTEYEGECIDRSRKVTQQIIAKYFQSKQSAKHLILVGHGASCYGMIECLAKNGGDYQGLACISHFKLHYAAQKDEDEEKQTEKKGNTDSFVIDTEFVGDCSHLSDKTNLRAF